MIRVVVVDDSALARKLVSGMLESDPEIEVVGTAMNGIFALRHVCRDNPDVVTMDFEMPQMDGLEALKAIMEQHPVPVVMLSAHTHEGAELTMKALDLGAVDFVPKPDGRESKALGGLCGELVEKVRAAACANVRTASLRHPDRGEGPRQRHAPESPWRSVSEPDVEIPDGVPSGTPPFCVPSPSDIGLIAIGASTGGVPGVSDILAALPANAPPTLVVQHMPATFTTGFARRLDGLSRVEVKEAEGGEKLGRGLALVARGDEHLGVKRRGKTLVAEVSASPKVSGHRPSVDFLFRSCARAAGDNCLGVILTGMGKDGAEGLREIRKIGGRTIAENEASCVIFGMPREAIKLGGAEFVLPAADIPPKVAGLVAASREVTRRDLTPRSSEH